MKKEILFFILMLCCYVECPGQTLFGKVADLKGNPIPYANVVLLSSHDSSFVKGTVSNENGLFSLDKIPLEKGILKISCIGYISVFKPDAIGDMGTILLREDTSFLKEVIVKGNIPVHQMTSEGLQINVSGTVIGKSGTAEDVLKYVPGLQKTEKGYEVFGKGSPLIYLNGKKIRNLSELDRLSSNEIKNITLITDPKAEYDASTNAVINIKTLHKTGDGFGGSYRQVIGQAHKFNHKEQFDWNYRKRGFDLFGTLLFSQGNSKQQQHTKQSIEGGKALLLKSNLSIYSQEDYGNGIVGFNYDFGGKQSLGATYTLGIPFRSGGRWNSLTDVSTGDLQTASLNDHFYSNDKKFPDHDASAYYSGSIGKIRIDWNGELYFTRTGTMQTSEEQETLHQDNRTVKTDYRSNSKLYASKLVVSMPVWKGEVTAGSEYSHIHRNSDYTVHGNSVQLPGNTDNRTTEGNIAGFLAYRVDIAKIHIDGGARLEHVSFRYYDHGIYMPTQSKSYNNLFPDLSISFPIKNVRADLSYTAKTRRPTYTMLSNNLQYNDRYTYQGGNPLLQPSIIHTIGLNLSYRWINFSANWKQYHNLFYQYIESYKNNSDITVFTFKNLSHSQAIYTGCTLTPKVGLWQPMVDVGIQKQFFHITENGSLRKYDHPIAFFTFNNAFQLPEDFIINVDMDYTTSGNSTAIKWEHSGEANIGIYKGILKDRLTFNIQINDIFNSYRNSNRLHYGDRDIYKWNRSDSRQLLLTVRYKFNSAKSKYKGTGAGNEEKSRL